MGTTEYLPEETEAALAAFDRRTFLKLMAAAGALAGNACTKPQPLEKIVPWVRAPEQMVAGVPRFYATALPTSGFASGFGRGVIVEQHEGRPTKIEGNPDHPSSLGATDIFMQAAILQLYDPDRSRACRRGASECTWGVMRNEWRQYLGRFGEGGEGGGAKGLRVRLLSPSLTSPSLLAQCVRLRNLFPQFRRHLHEMPGTTSAREGQRLAFGRPVTPIYDFGRVRRVVALDSHFLFDEPGSLRYAREFARARRGAWHELQGGNRTHVGAAWREPPLDANQMLRLYVAESTVTSTGASADHRVAVRPSMLPAVAAALGKAIGGSATSAAAAPHLPEDLQRWVDAAAADLLAHRGASLVLAGEYLPPPVHALVHAMNATLGAPGNGVTYLEPIDAAPAEDASLAALARDLDAGDVDLLIMLDANPAFTSPGSLHFADSLREFAKRGPAHKIIHIGAYVDETAGLSDWHVPLAHPLEAWGDLRGHDGTVSIVQPLIEPLFSGRAALEVLAALAAVAGEMQGESAAELYIPGYDRLKTHWLSQWSPPTPPAPAGAPATANSGAALEMQWRKALRDGIIDATAARPAAVAALALPAALAAVQTAETKNIEIVFRPDPAIGDGFWANVPWLQELPRPLTHVTWENVAIACAETARGLGLAARGEGGEWRGRGGRGGACGWRWTGGGWRYPWWCRRGWPRGWWCCIWVGGGAAPDACRKGWGWMCIR
ncbi:MAG TPA: hypothetical protein VHM90_10970 [Phycisphaerae bacterium]|nr:hypothetical protein [Phycisphaerae bacterium]